jgi:hypothetical protein
LEKSSKNQTDRKTKRLAEAEASESDISPFPDRHGISQDTECRWKTHGCRNALESAE